MTQKELLYLEDTLNHLQTIKDLLNNAKENLESTKLRSFVSKQLTKTKQQFEKVYGMLGE